MIIISTYRKVKDYVSCEYMREKQTIAPSKTGLGTRVDGLLNFGQTMEFAIEMIWKHC